MATHRPDPEVRHEVDVGAADQAAESRPTEPQWTVAQVEDQLRRALADAQNIRKRCAQQIATERAAERAQVASAFLPVLDNLERALDHAGTDPQAIVEGVRAMRDQAIALLTEMGYTRHDETGVPFDPQRHDAVRVRPASDAEPGTVLEVVLPGYGNGERQLRPAAVVVAGYPE